MRTLIALVTSVSLGLFAAPAFSQGSNMGQGMSGGSMEKDKPMKHKAKAKKSKMSEDAMKKDGMAKHDAMAKDKMAK